MLPLSFAFALQTRGLEARRPKPGAAPTASMRRRLAPRSAGPSSFSLSRVPRLKQVLSRAA
jgi:hypothetical protein